MENRILSFENIHNVRDLGGIQTADGHIIRQGLLIRSASLFGATADDAAKLAEQYRLAKIIDLRTGAETREKPDAQVPGAHWLPIPVFEERMVGISHEKENRKVKVIPKMEPLYHMIVTDPHCLENLGNAAKIIMEHDFSQGSILWHCTEGKDRCGLLSMTLLSALGVDREQIMVDYLLTNLVNDPKAQRYYQEALTSGKTEQEAEALRDAYLAKASYLNTAFDAIDRLYGGPAEFLTSGLAICEDTLHHFRKQLLQDVTPPADTEKEAEDSALD